jgi:hypothetical protein
LLVRTWAPVNYYWKHRSFTVKGAYGAVDQKPDDITPLGITRPVTIYAAGQVRIQNLAVDTRLTTNGDAEVEVEVDLDKAPEQAVQVELTLSPRNFSAPERHWASTTLAGPHGKGADSSEGPAVVVDVGSRQAQFVHAGGSVA